MKTKNEASSPPVVAGVVDDGGHEHREDGEGAEQLRRAALGDPTHTHTPHTILMGSVYAFAGGLYAFFTGDVHAK